VQIIDRLGSSSEEISANVVNKFCSVSSRFDTDFEKSLGGRGIPL
jgi:hypothetical protein